VTDRCSSDPRVGCITLGCGRGGDARLPDAYDRPRQNAGQLAGFSASIRRCAPAGDELDSDGACRGAGFVPHIVHVITTRIEKHHSLRVHSGLAGGIIAFVIGHCSRRDDDKAVAREGVPAGTPSRLPGIALHVQV